LAALKNEDGGVKPPLRVARKERKGGREERSFVPVEATGTQDDSRRRWRRKAAATGGGEDKKKQPPMNADNQRRTQKDPDERRSREEKRKRGRSKSCRVTKWQS
jgi:hypothetical protein